MGIQDPKVTAQILKTLHHVEVLATRLESVATLASTPATSLAAADARMSARLGLEPFLNAGFQLSVSLDHLQTWRHVVFGGGAGLQPAYAHMTLLRGAMEAAVVARWLVDSEVDPSERLARSADWDQVDYTKRKRIEEIIRARPKPPAKLASERMADLEAAARAIGLRPLRAVNVTDLFRAYCSQTGNRGELIYSMMSAFAHGRSWSVFVSTLTPVGPGLPGTGGLGTIGANDDHVVAFTITAVRTAMMAVKDLERYCGV
jgi:hypothetical protein